MAPTHATLAGGFDLLDTDCRLVVCPEENGQVAVAQTGGQIVVQGEALVPLPVFGDPLELGVKAHSKREAIYPRSVAEDREGASFEAEDPSGDAIGELAQCKVQEVVAAFLLPAQLHAAL